MPTTHVGSRRALDTASAYFDAIATASWTASTHDSSAFDHGAADDDERDPGFCQVQWPGIVGGATSTISFMIEDSPDGSGSWLPIVTTAVVDTDGTDGYDPANVAIPMPAVHRRYTRLAVIVGTAALAAGSGVIHAGFLRGPSGPGADRDA